MVLLLDIGNSHIKWACWDGTLSDIEREPHRGCLPDDFVDRLAPMPTPDRVLISNVAGERMAASCRAAFQAQWGLSPTFLYSRANWRGVTSGYVHPESLGIDRWLAVVAAFERYKCPVLIVDCGTAVTVDAVDACGKHLGGLILPGFDLARRAVLSGTNIPNCRPDGRMAFFANNTVDAVGAAPAQAVAALVRHAIAELMHQGENVMLALTGGGVEEIKPLLDGIRYEEFELVIEGLALAARTGLE